MAGKRSSAKKPANAASLPPVPAGAGLVVYEGASDHLAVVVDKE